MIQELIKVKGNQVAPAKFESMLLENPKIADAAVIGIPQYVPFVFSIYFH